MNCAAGKIVKKYRQRTAKFFGQAKNILLFFLLATLNLLLPRDQRSVDLKQFELIDYRVWLLLRHLYSGILR